MKNAVGTATNQGNVQTDQRTERAKVSPAAYGVIMDLLSNIYTDSAAAVLREYSVNGWDEHRKHGVERPVEVTLPSTLQPTLLIRDFAKGLPMEGTFHLDDLGEVVWDQYGVMQVFGEYGESSKRQTDDEVGGFGIGSKAAFALGHQFMVTSYRDGEFFTALFTLGEDGVGTKSIIAEGSTSQPNGVEISLGVDDVEAMRESAARFFSFWDRGHVLVDGEEPTPVFESLDRVSDEIYIQPDGRGEAYAVMGPVAYPVDRVILRKVATYLEEHGMDEEVATLPLRLVSSSTDLYLRVPIGSVVPAPSREALRDKDQTVHTLAGLFLAIHQESQVKIQAEVDAAPSFFAAAKALHEGNEGLGAFKVSRKSVPWNGQRILKEAPVPLRNYRMGLKSYRSSVEVVLQEDQFTAAFPSVENVLVVTGVAVGQEGTVRRFAKRVLESEDHDWTRIVVTDADAASYGWFQFGVEQGARTVDLAAWRALVKTIRSNTPKMVNEPSYTTGFQRASRDLEDRDLLSEIIGEGRDIVIWHDSAAHLGTYLRKALEDYTVVVLLGTQSEAALRKRIEEDGTVSVVEQDVVRAAADALAQADLDTATQAEFEALGAREWLREHRYQVREFSSLADNLVLAGGTLTSRVVQEAQDAVLLAEVFAAPLTDARFNLLRAAASQVDKDLDDLKVDYVDGMESLSERYPLLDVNAVNRVAGHFARYTEVEEDGTRSINWAEAKTTWGSIRYSEEDLARDIRYLQHALAYVNTVG